jgi:hypothetical protein
MSVFYLSNGLSYPSTFYLSVPAAEADFAFGRSRGWCHELRYRVEDDAELFVVFFLQCRQFAGEFFVVGEHAAQAYEGPHDLDIHLHRPLAAQDAGQYGHALFRESIGTVLSMLPAAAF